MAMGACSREEPQPKFHAGHHDVAVAVTSVTNAASMSSMQWEASSLWILGGQIPGGDDDVGIHVVAVLVDGAVCLHLIAS